MRLANHLIAVMCMIFSIVVSVATGVMAQARPTAEPMPYLGMKAASASDYVARQLGISARDGVVVLATDVVGPIDAAGLSRGDRIVEFAGTPVHNVDELIAVLASRRVGDTEAVIYFRGAARRTAKVVLAGQAADGVAATPPSRPPLPGATPTKPATLNEPQVPAGWIEKRVGDLTVYIPPDWTPVPFLASDEGCWFVGSEDDKKAIFAIIRDVPKDELLAPMTIERERPETLAGREAVGYFGPTVEQKIAGRGLVVYPKQREADRSLLGVLCFASAETWSTKEATFRTMLSLIRRRAVSP